MVTNDNQNSKFYTFQSFMLILSRTGQPLLTTSCFYGCIGLSETDLLYDRTGQSETIAFLAGLVNFDQISLLLLSELMIYILVKHSTFISLKHKSIKL